MHPTIDKHVSHPDAITVQLVAPGGHGPIIFELQPDEVAKLDELVSLHTYGETREEVIRYIMIHTLGAAGEI
jgi:hypothetical protein